MESSDAQLEELKRALNDAEAKASQADKDLTNAQSELERVRPFEKEVREKNLLIGKLRHEAVTLNDHLTKALRFLKKGKPEDNVDRYVHTWTYFRFYVHYRHFCFFYLVLWLTIYTGILSRIIYCISSPSIGPIPRNFRSYNLLQRF